MKKIYSVFTMLLFLTSVLAIQIALAENKSLFDSKNLPEQSSLILEAPEEIPSTFRYNWERFKLNFIRNQTRRAEREIQLARWKVTEARIATQRGNIEKAERALRENEKLMQRVQERISKIDNNQSLTPGLDNSLRVHTERINSLNAFLEETNLSEEQRVRIEARIDRIKNVSQVLEQNRERIQELRQERLGDLQERLKQRQGSS